MADKSTKTWIVNSGKSRHPEMDGETVGIDKTFSNGLSYPGDPAGSPDETMGCQCTLEMNFNGETQELIPAETQDLVPGEPIRKFEAKRDEWMSNLSEENADLYARYDSTNLYSLNYRLRELGENTAQSQIEKVIASAGETLAEDTVFYRGMGDINVSTLGDVFMDKGLPFMTGNPAVAIEFGSQSLGGASAPILEILMPVGSKFIYGNYVQYTERLFERGWAFQVVGEGSITTNVYGPNGMITKTVKTLRVTATRLDPETILGAELKPLDRAEFLRRVLDSTGV